MLILFANAQREIEEIETRDYQKKREIIRMARRKIYHI